LGEIARAEGAERATGLSRARAALAEHWPEYLMEAFGLGAFMVSAAVFSTLLEFSGSPARTAIPDPVARRALMGLAMGLTAVAIIYSPWGKRSGAHINPAVTLAFFHLGKVAAWDTAFYVTFQFLGAAAGVAAVAPVLGSSIADPFVRYVVTLPAGGTAAAFLAELAISAGLMATVLFTTNRASLARYTGVFAGVLVAAYILVEAPVSGMSMNPARTFGSAVVARLWTGVWIYFTAPPLGMLLAAETYRRWRKRPPICAKLHHHNDQRCIFRGCGYMEGNAAGADARPEGAPREEAR